MSVRVMADAWLVDIAAGEKLVLLALADCANDEGRCWPGVKSLCRKTGKGERSLQGALISLENGGHITRDQIAGKGCKYVIHPNLFLDLAPAKSAPRSYCAPQKTAQTPAKSAGTPAKSAGKPSKKHQEPPNSISRAIPDDWQPSDFSEGTEARKLVDSWPPGEFAAQVEQFKANHDSKGNTFKKPQRAWQTWVLNTRKFGIGKNDRQERSPTREAYDLFGLGQSRQ